MSFVVFVDDNYHYTDEDERYRLGEFDNLAAAIDACKRIVDNFLTQHRKPGMDAEGLYLAYTMFGEDPFIVGGNGEKRESFSAWDYAKVRAEEMCR